MAAFQVGDVVRLRSGGPLMTVRVLRGEVVMANDQLYQAIQGMSGPQIRAIRKDSPLVIKSRGVVCDYFLENAEGIMCLCGRFAFRHEQLELVREAAIVGE